MTFRLPPNTNRILKKPKMTLKFNKITMIIKVWWCLFKSALNCMNRMTNMSFHLRSQMHHLKFKNKKLIRARSKMIYWDKRVSLSKKLMTPVKMKLLQKVMINWIIFLLRKWRINRLSHHRTMLKLKAIPKKMKIKHKGRRLKRRN